jgi:virulence-associated protein VagC
LTYTWRLEVTMRTATVFEDGEGQAVIIPEDMRFEAGETWIWRDQETGEVHLSPKLEPSNVVPPGDVPPARE